MTAPAERIPAPKARSLARAAALLAIAAAALPRGEAGAQALKGPSGQLPLSPSAVPRFVQPLPLPAAQDPAPPARGLPPVPPFTLDVRSGTAPLTIHMCELDANVLPPGTISPGVQTPTRVFGYAAGACPTSPQDTYVGPVIVAARGTPTAVTWVNSLPTGASTGVLAWKHGIDQTLHWADPLGDETNACATKGATGGFVDPRGRRQDFPPPGDLCAGNYAGPIPAVPHLHGGEVPAEVDGSPDAWFTSDGARRGRRFYTQGVVGEVTALPALPSARWPAGSIAYDTSTGGWHEVVTAAGQAGAPPGVRWQPYRGNRARYVYPNRQEAAPLWFHDHTLGATRLNVYAGLAGAYVIDDPAALAPDAASLPPASSAIPLVLQDRQFDANGQLFFPATALDPQHPYWRPEFLGDVVVVNGKAWPYLVVSARRHRFLVLNGSNARTYELSLQHQETGAAGPSMWVVGGDGGYLDAPQEVSAALGHKLVVMPGERYDVVVDFRGLGGSTLLLRNTAKAPYPDGAAPDEETIGRILQVRVRPGAPADASYDPASRRPLRAAPVVRLANPARIRQLTLNEAMAEPTTAVDPVTARSTRFPGGPTVLLVNNTMWSGLDPATLAPRADFTPVATKGKTAFVSETPKEGETELWEIVNLTPDAHPVHLHLVQVQLVSRQAFELEDYGAAYAAAFPSRRVQPGYGPPLDYATGNPRALGGNPDVAPFLRKPMRPPAGYERGWKDTVVAPPGMVTRFLVRWAPTSAAGGTPFPFDPSGKDGATGREGSHAYVWHCHIIDHEDNEMMRPVQVRAAAGVTRTWVKGPGPSGDY